MREPDDRWSIDFAADQFSDGRRLRTLVVVDDCTRECLALVTDTSISGIRVARELDRLLFSTENRATPRGLLVVRLSSKTFRQRGHRRSAG